MDIQRFCPVTKFVTFYAVCLSVLMSLPYFLPTLMLLCLICCDDAYSIVLALVSQFGH